jgi:flagellar assembly protein FliH
MSSSPELFEFGALVGTAGAGQAGTAAERAVRLLAEATAEAHAIREQAAAAGRAEGYAAGLAAPHASHDPAAAALRAAAEGLVAERETFLTAAERHTVELAIQIAEKVIGAAVRVDPDAMLAVVASALRRTAVRGHLVVQVHPDDFDLVRDAADGIAAGLGGIGCLEVVSERRVGRGGCVVRTGEGEIDATVEEQLTRVRELAADALRAGDDG